jgi:hypothetical protein
MAVMNPAHNRKKKTKVTGHPLRQRGAPFGPAVGKSRSGTQIWNEYPNVIIEP